MNLHELKQDEPIQAMMEKQQQVLSESIFNLLRRLEPELRKDFGMFNKPPKGIVNTIASIITWMDAHEQKQDPAEIGMFYGNDDDKIYEVVYRFSTRMPQEQQQSVQKVMQAIKQKQIPQLFQQLSQFFQQRTSLAKQQQENPQQQRPQGQMPLIKQMQAAA